MSRVSADLASAAHYPSPDANGVLHSVSRTNASNTPKVAIIGAGISGLRAADLLIHAGAKVTIFEARERIGGRLHQVESGGHLMDLGPNWIHGGKGNPIEVLARLTRTVLDSLDEEEAVFDVYGTRLGDAESKRLAGIIGGIIVNAFKYSDEHSETIGVEESLMDYFRAEIPKYEKDPEKVERLLEMSRTWGSSVGEAIETQSLKYFFLEEYVDGENLFVAGTYKKILYEIAKTALAHADIKFDTEVAHFQPNEDDSTITLTTVESVRHTFDEVIITCPLGWLKQHCQTAFPPSLLPPRITKAINNLGYGRLEKVYVTFPIAFWTSQGQPYPIFTQFLNPAYLPQSNTSGVSWNQSLVSLHDLPGETARPTLLFYLYGDCAEFMVASINNLAPNSAEHNQALTELLEPFYSRLPSYDPGNPKCHPTAFLATTWQTDRFAGNGAYTNFPVGREGLDDDLIALREGMGLGERFGLWFAGEHCAPFVAVGTTTGAWWSGEGVARRVSRKHQLEILFEDRELNGIEDETMDVGGWDWQES